MGSGQSALNKGDGFPSCAKWISDTSLRFGKRESPTPLVFQKELRLSVLPRRAEILCTAMGAGRKANRRGLFCAGADLLCPSAAIPAL